MGAAVPRHALAACFFFGWLAVIAQMPLAGQGPTYLPWREPAAVARLVFTRAAQNEFCLLVAPARTGAEGVIRDGVARAGDKNVPVSIIWSDPSNIVFLADCRRVPARQELALYLFAAPQTPSTNAPVVDPSPVRFYAQRTAGQDLPASWDQVQMLDSRVDREPCLQSMARFEARDGAPSGWYRGDWQRKSHLFEFSAWVLFPVTGRYLFGLQTDLPAWLLVDGEPVVGHAATRQLAWTNSAPILIPAGLHRVVARGVAQQRLNFLADWRQEGCTNAPGVMAITGGWRVPARWEQQGDRLHAMAEVTTEPTYTFAGVTNLFVPIRLESRSVSADRRALHYSWRQADHRELGQEARGQAVLCAEAGPSLIHLQVTDDQGHTAQDQVLVPIPRGPARTLYTVAGRLTGVPACGYEEDVIRPELQLRATSPDSVVFQVEADIRYANGAQTNLTGMVEMKRAWGRMVLPANSADSFQQIAWRIRHAGVTLDQGLLVFERAPFCTLPTALDGEQLLINSNAVMLVAHRASAGENPVLAGVRPEDRVLVLDGFLMPQDERDARLGARLDNLLSDEGVIAQGAYRRVNWSLLEESSGVQGVARLQSLVQIGRLLPAEVVVVAPSFAALGQGESLAQYERRLATLIGLLTGPGHARVVMTTPPPFSVLPGCEGLPSAAGQPPNARQLAEIICRVADAYGQPVADLYTSFMASGRRASLLGDGVLTPEGVAFAGDVLRRSLYGPQKGSY